MFSLCLPARAAEPPQFFRGLNLNGPAVTIDGHDWEGKDSQHYQCRDKAFENQQVRLVPDTDADRAAMIRSSRWGGNRIDLTEVPAGEYSVFLYVWEDNNPETFAIAINDRQLVPQYNSGSTGHWEKLGPWFVSPEGGKIVLTSRGGAANFSGIELWRGRHDGLEQPISDEDLTFFEKRIRPLLVSKCYACHSAEAKQLEGELLVDSRATVRRGGASGPAVVPGKPEQSLLIEAVRYQNESMQMPPDAKLSAEEIADLERWVSRGAPDPRAAVTKHIGRQIDVVAAREFWSLKPLVAPAVPNVENAAWPRNDLDHFLLAAMESRGLEPAPDADRRIWLRRATYDLIGLPPTPDEIQDFLADPSEDAERRVVDRLLDSPRYGERWGRHWLDVVRYADTAGDNSDYPIPQMHRYRDWVIEAFNRDLPYDEFVRDQLAGDLRGGETEETRQRRIIATGYLANSRRFGSRVDDYPWHLTIEDTIDNLGRSFLGLSLSCTRCHDHKFDPFTTRDYYGLYGMFASTRYPWPGIELDKRQRDFVPLAASDQLPELRRQREARLEQRKQLDGQRKTLQKQLKSASDQDKTSLQKQLDEVEQRLQKLASQPPLFETAYAVAEAASPHDVAVQIKGDPAKPGDVVRRHFPAVLGGGELPADHRESGRRELAEWIVAVDNPLPARVMANRIWQHHFGRGIVATPNDFGKQGKPPTHPELLDYLAVQFRDGGWSVKSLHRLVMLSRAYRQSSQRSPRALEVDPANDSLSGFRRRRLDAEAIRDTLLMHGGNLELGPAGAHPFPAETTWDFTQHKPFKAVYESNRRSVYLMTQRIQRHPFLAIFDGADPSASTAARSSSTTPIQALYLLNDPWLHDQSTRIAERLLAASPADGQRIEQAFAQLFGRAPTQQEASDVEKFLDQARTLLRESDVPSERLEAECWQACVRSLLRLNEFVYVD
ncbi:MAG: DUF1553 domain-containing protein [Planctomycetales bacterium]|nr:DUF1553 domain-containing protein [Planctomycetales bacterium]